MLTDIQLEKYAQVLFWGMQKARVTPFAPGDIVLVRTDMAALNLAEKVQALLLAKGLNPVVRITPPSQLEKAITPEPSRTSCPLSYPETGNSMNVWTA